MEGLGRDPEDMKSGLSSPPWRIEDFTRYPPPNKDGMPNGALQKTIAPSSWACMSSHTSF